MSIFSCIALKDTSINSEFEDEDKKKLHSTFAQCDQPHKSQFKRLTVQTEMHASILSSSVT